jgi:2-polyprenyl-3-methyl-5-hydroxy-6-metoxy-1,4-benzoquinol methylase
LKKLILRTLSFILDILPARWTMKTLFKIDQMFYYLQQQAALRYGNGVHPKHRLLNYHQFFANRISTDEAVLDIGCGYGALAHSIGEAGAKVTGIDYNEKSLDQARENFVHPNVNFVYGDVLKTEFADPFDVVVMSNVLEHIAERPEFLRRVTQSVRPQRWLIRVPLFERDWRVPLKKELGVEYRLDPTHFIEYTQETFAEEMEEARLDITHLEIRWGEIWAELKPKA